MIFRGYHAKKYTPREFLALAGNILSRRLEARCCPSECIVAAIRKLIKNRRKRELLEKRYKLKK